MNILEIIKKFPDQETCIKHLETVRWGDTPICPYCNSTNTNALEKELRHHCNGCRKSFSVTVGTIFHHTHIDLQKWFLVMSLMLNARKGLSAYQIARDLGMRRPTVWSMMHRIREAMESEEGELLQGIVEMDETYIGGKPRKGNKKDDDGDNKSGRGRGTKKTPVVGMVERDGRVRAEATTKYELKSKDLKKLVRENIDLDNSILMTDEYRGYMTMNQIITHLFVNHQKAYVTGNNIHTNTIEGFWSILKRSIIGQFHKVSVKYLQKYIDECSFKYNHRKLNSEFVFGKLVRNSISRSGNMLLA